MMRSKTGRAAVAGVLGALLLVACGGDDDTSGSTPAADSSVAASTPAVTEAPPAETDADTVPETVTDTVPATVDGTAAAPSTGAAPATDDAGVDVDGLIISDFSFSAAAVPAGVEFTLTNEDDFAHTVTNRDGVFDVRVEGGSTEPLTIERTGTYEIFCRIHPSMSGTITVV